MFYPTNGIFGDYATGFFGVNNTTPSVAWDITGALSVSGTVALGSTITATSIATPILGIEFLVADSLIVEGTIATPLLGTELAIDDSVDVSGVLLVTGDIKTDGD